MCRVHHRADRRTGDAAYLPTGGHPCLHVSRTAKKSSNDASRLRKYLTRSGRTWPGLPDVQDVHVAVGPGGVVVVAERTWTGHVVVEGGVLRHDGFRCERDIEALQAAMGAVTALLPAEHRDTVIGIIHVTPRDMPPARISGITVVGRLHLASMLVNLPQRLSPLDVADITRWLTRAVEVPVTPLVTSGGAAMSTGTVFYPSSPGSSDTAAYFVPRQPAAAPSVPAAPAVAVPEYDDASWALLYPSNNRFGIR